MCVAEAVLRTASRLVLARVLLVWRLAVGGPSELVAERGLREPRSTTTPRPGCGVRFPTPARAEPVCAREMAGNSGDGRFTGVVLLVRGIFIGL